MDQDPNLAMTRLVNRSREKREKGTGAAPPEAPRAPETPPPQTPPAATPPPEPPKLAELLGRTLRFGPKGPPKQEPPAGGASPAAPAATPATPPATPPPAPTTPPAATPAATSKKKPKAKPGPMMDPAAIATAAATAATEAAVRAVTKAAPQTDPGEELSADDRHDYEVAQHLAKIDPRYKDAPQIILDQIRQAEDYASGWQAANPGKAFDPGDEEHDEFYAQLARPWTDAEFRRAEIKLEARKEADELNVESNKRLAAMEADSARMELAPTVEQKFIDVTVEMAKLVGDEVAQTLTTGGWPALDKQDPVLAQVMAATLDQVHPFVEAAIQIDDPRQRIRIDPRNPTHQQWNQVVMTGEASLVGTQIEDGRMFAKRSDYVKMSPAQQSQHWYLTTDMIIQGAVDYAAAQVKLVAEQQKKRLESLGFVRQPATPAAPAAGGSAPVPSQQPAPASAVGVPIAAVKPASPSVGSGAKIDDTGGAPRSGEAALMHQISNILFRR